MKYKYPRPRWYADGLPFEPDLYDDEPPLPIEFVGMEGTFDNPDNPNARWGRIYGYDYKEYRVYIEHVGWGYEWELKGLRKAVSDEAR